jgi:hypothetical protein
VVSSVPIIRPANVGWIGLDIPGLRGLLGDIGTAAERSDSMGENITLEEAQSNLPALIDRLKPGSEIVITRNNQPVFSMRSTSRFPVQCLAGEE